MGEPPLFLHYGGVSALIGSFIETEGRDEKSQSKQKGMDQMTLNTVCHCICYMCLILNIHGYKLQLG